MTNWSKIKISLDISREKNRTKNHRNRIQILFIQFSSTR